MLKALMPFQKEGAIFLASSAHALLADEPGLGKTLQAIAAAEALELKTKLVICPASVRSNWLQEIEECLGSAAGWDIWSYNTASKLAIARRHQNWDAIIMDEAHFLKTPDSQRTQALYGNGTGLARRATFKWALTGTPAVNRPRELYPTLKTLASDHIAPYDSYAKFTQRFCGAYFDGRGINDRGATHTDDLARRLRGFMLRRTKAEVMPQLPPRITSRVPLDIPFSELAPVLEEERLIADRKSYISSTHEKYAQLGDLSRLLRVTGVAKAPAVARFVEDKLYTVQKVVIFARHREVISTLYRLLADKGRHPVVYHGGMSDAQKDEAVQCFVKRASVKVFIGQIAAAGTGINGLQKVCNDVVFGELSWVPGETGQAIDRCHRIGQKGLAVNAYLLHVPGTMESAVLNTHDGKEKVIARLMGDTVVSKAV